MRLSKYFFIIFLVSLLVSGGNVFAMSSTNFLIQWDNLNLGGLDNSSSTNFSSRDTLGDNASGTSTSANFQLSAGYRAPEGSNILTYQARSISTSVSTAYNAFNNVLDTVTVASTAGIAIGDLIAVVENSGFSQFVAVGKVTQITGLVISVDSFDGDDTLMSAVPTGGDDFVYLLNSNSINFGTVSAGNEYTSVVGTSVLTNVSTGYSLYIAANQLLQNTSAQVITSVTDGTVTAGVEEYGAEVTGSSAFSPNTDLAVSTTQRIIQTSGFATGPVPHKIAMIYKLSITSSTNSGVYSQNVYYTLTANY